MFRTKRVNYQPLFALLFHPIAHVIRQVSQSASQSVSQLVLFHPIAPLTSDVMAGWRFCAGIGEIGVLKGERSTFLLAISLILSCRVLTSVLLLSNNSAVSISICRYCPMIFLIRSNSSCSSATVGEGIVVKKDF